MKEPLILHIETSGALCSVAVSMGSEVRALIESDEEYDHSRTLAPFIDAIQEQAQFRLKDLDAISVSGGPGSFTGLRVGISTAKAMCFVLGCPMIAVDTLESLALAAIAKEGMEGIYYATIDARRMEVYLAAFDARGERLTANRAVIVDAHTFDPLLEVGETVVMCGTGTSKCMALLGSLGVRMIPIECSARHLVAPALKAFDLQAFADLAAFTPEYLKAPHITVSQKPEI